MSRSVGIGLLSTPKPGAASARREAITFWIHCSWSSSVGGFKCRSEIPSVVYDFYTSQVIAKGFSVSPDDQYSALAEGDDEITEDAQSLLEKLQPQ